VSGRLLRRAAAVAVASQVLPAATWIPGVRIRLAPALAGLGRPGHLALTFDDGPDAASTPQFLHALDDLGWRATFFVLGEQLRRAPGLLRDLSAAGHEIGLHGDRHRYLLARTPAAARDDLTRGRDAVGDLIGHPPAWFRPPYGVLSGSGQLAARRLHLRPVLWSAWGRDWRAEATAASVLDDLTAGVLDGGTALLHDSDVTSVPGAWRAALGALPLLAEEAARLGLTVGPLREHGIRF
jgi:peptidoglycan/xylan/chitin deacetylase (PgdA/CDA1 family)